MGPVYSASCPALTWEKAVLVPLLLMTCVGNPLCRPARLFKTLTLATTAGTGSSCSKEAFAFGQTTQLSLQAQQCPLDRESSGL